MSKLPKFTPIYSAYNDVAVAIVQELYAFLGLNGGTKTKPKHLVILASFLAAAQRMSDEQRMIWYTGNDTETFKPYAYYPATGTKVVANVRKALEQRGILAKPKTISMQEANPELEPDFLEFYMVASGFDFNRRPAPREVPATVFQVDLTACPALDDLYSATFVEVHKPHILVNKKEDIEEKHLRIKNGLQKTKFSLTEAPIEFGSDYSKIHRTSAKLHKMWLEHPLEKPHEGNQPSEYYATAKRIFHNGSIIEGGRYYGTWTQMSGSERLKLLIDGEQVAQIDLNAANVTLLSALLRKPMEVGPSWTDAYAAVVERIDFAGQSHECIRKKVKQVIVELCGLSNPAKSKPAMNCDSPFCTVDEAGNVSMIANASDEFTSIRDEALKVFPALNSLNNRYNSAGYLIYHESQLITDVMLALYKHDIVSYPMHDCILLKQSKWIEAVTIIVDVCKTYFRNKGKGKPKEECNLSPALTIEFFESDKVRQKGYYY